MIFSFPQIVSMATSPSQVVFDSVVPESVGLSYFQPSLLLWFQSAYVCSLTNSPYLPILLICVLQRFLHIVHFYKNMPKSNDWTICRAVILNSFFHQIPSQTDRNVSFFWFFPVYCDVMTVILLIFFAIHRCIENFMSSLLPSI